MGAKVSLEVQDRLICLLRDSFDEVEVVGAGAILPSFDYHCPLLSLPRALGTELANIPDKVPYLFAERQRVREWAKSQGGRWERGRSIPLACYQALAEMPGVRLISLQKDRDRERRPTLPCGMAVETLGDDFDAGDSAFLDTAAVMENLDLVVTCDTAIAHLAGALGRPTWVALRFIPDWRWLLDRSDSPWYPTMRLFRQKAVQDWSSAFAQMRDALHESIDGR
jgi:hypothetical protein